MYGNLQRIFVPYSTHLHCRHLEALARSFKKRSVAVTFIGSVSSRVRQWLLELSREPSFTMDKRVFLRLSGAGAGQEIRAQTRSGARASTHVPTLNFTQLYMDSDFCLVLPGHLHDLTKRCYDAMAQGCLPVIVTKPQFWMAVPFVATAPWGDFAAFRRVASKDELRKVLSQLLQRYENDQAAIRQQRRALSRTPGLFITHDTNGCMEAERGAFVGYLLDELVARQIVWPHIRSSWLDAD